MSKNVFALLKRSLLEKCRDPSMFTLPCVIGDTQFFHAMLNLGASINVMPYHVFVDLKLNDLQNTYVIIQLADRSYNQPLGVVEDVLVQVKELIFPDDFYILNTNITIAPSSTTILLGRPFIKTAKTKINVDEGTLFVEFDGDVEF